MRQWLLIVLVVAGLLLLDVGQRIHMINLGYEIEQLIGKHRDLQKIHKELLVERETLSSLNRIEPIAVQQLGMRRPEPGQVIQVYSPSGNEMLSEKERVVSMAGGVK